MFLSIAGRRATLTLGLVSALLAAAPAVLAGRSTAPLAPRTVARKPATAPPATGKLLPPRAPAKPVVPGEPQLVRLDAEFPVEGAITPNGIFRNGRLIRTQQGPVRPKPVPVPSLKRTVPLGKNRTPVTIRDIRGLRTRAPRSHGPGPWDLQVTQGPNLDIEPQYVHGMNRTTLSPNATARLWSSSSGPQAPEPDPDDDFLKEPPYTDRSFTWVIRTSHRGTVNFSLADDGLVGDFFEPNAGRGRNNSERRLAFSAFINSDREVYNQDIPGADYDENGPAVRVIGISDDALDGGVNEPTITKWLNPRHIATGTREIPSDDPDAEPEVVSFGIYAPDATPAVYPQNSRFVVFVRFSSFDLKSTDNTTSLWLWDTAKESDDPTHVRQILSIRGKSILFPRWSPDGSYLAYTVTDYTFGTVEYPLPGGDGGGGGGGNPASDPLMVPEDPILPFDVTGEAYAKEFTSDIEVRAVVIGLTDDDQARVRWGIDNPLTNLGFGTYKWGGAIPPITLSAFANDEGKRSRDLMPFWSETNQIGFSSDRIDSDGDGIADAVPADAASGRFSIYAFEWPFKLPSVTGPGMLLPYENPDDPTRMPYQETLGIPLFDADGNPIVDDANELRGDWAPPLLDDYGILDNSTYGTLASKFLYQSDEATKPAPGQGEPDWDLWMTDYTQFLVNQGGFLDGLPKVTPKLATPSQPVSISVKLRPAYVTRDNDGAATVGVWALIKDPDNRLYSVTNGATTQDASPRYGRGTDRSTMTSVADGVAMMMYREQNQEPVRFTDIDADNYAEFYTGAPGEPQFGHLVELTEAVPGSNEFGASWWVPDEASDYLIDVIIMRPQDYYPMLSDNVGGFSSAPFVPYSWWLVVSDFAQGQKSVPYTTATASTAAVATESYFTERPMAWWGYPPGDPSAGQTVALFGNLYPDIDVVGPRTEFQHYEPGDPVIDPVTGWLNNVASVPNPDQPLRSSYGPIEANSGGPYDLWRTQCRDAISMDVLKNYLPYTIQQPGWPDAKRLRTQTVQTRAVMWFAPHCGQLNGNAGKNALENGIGTIANPDTQQVLMDFISQRGRIFVAGDDIAFTLTAESSASNAFLAKMKVKFYDHFAKDVIFDPYNFDRTEPAAVAGGSDTGTNTISHSWNTAAHNEQVTSFFLAPFYSPWVQPGMTLGFPVRPTGSPDHTGRTHEDAALTNLYIDAVIPTGGGRPTYSLNDARLVDDPTTPEADRPVGAVEYELPFPGKNTSDSRLFYMSWGAEGLDRNWTNSDGSFVPRNPLAQLAHNLDDYFLTGAIEGQVFLSNDTVPVNNVIVRAYEDWRNRVFQWSTGSLGPDGTGPLLGTDLTGPTTLYPTKPDGYYRIDGLDASIYRLFCYKTGYAFQNPLRLSVEGALTSDGANLYLIPVNPGKLIGTVKDATTGAPLPGVKVTITDIQNAFSFSTVTDADGKFAFNEVPAGQWYIHIDAVTVGDKTYAAYDTPVDAPVVVASNTTTNVDIRLQTAVTPPGVGTAAGLATDIDNNPLGGVIVTAYDRDGKVATALNGTSNPATTDVSGNWSMSLAADSYTFVADGKAHGYDKTITKGPVVVVKDTTTTVATFVFGAAVQSIEGGKVLMIAAPYDYTGTSFRDVLYKDIPGVTDDALKTAIVAWDAGKQGFTFYPTYPADTFHLGRGYGVKLPQNANIKEEGNPAVVGTNGYYAIRTEIGWNLIGNPFLGDVNWEATSSSDRSVRVALRDDSSGTMYTVQEAQERGILTSPLWGGYNTVNGSAYVGSYQQTDKLEPWHGYWVMVSQPSLLYVPKPSASSSVLLRTGDKAAPKPLMPNADIWGVNVTATCGDLRDDGLALGLGTTATSGRDRGKDFAKPTPLESSQPGLFTTFSAPAGQYAATDIRGSRFSGSWRFVVATNQAGQTVTLKWTATGKLPAGAKVYLVDAVSKKAIDMSGRDNYSYKVGRNGETRTFRVEIKRKGARG